MDKDPGDDLLLHGLGHTTIGAAAFHFRVRDGIGWFHSAMVARERVEGRVGSGGLELSRSRSRRGDVANIVCGDTFIDNVLSRVRRLEVI